LGAFAFGAHALVEHSVSLGFIKRNSLKRGGRIMDWNRIEGNWKQAKGTIREKWGQLTDDDLAQVNGKRDQLEGKIQERYGLARDVVRKNVDDWLDQQR
jgi:uncharacterized protein YjbJ (UPF0337 family)